MTSQLFAFCFSNICCPQVPACILWTLRGFTFNYCRHCLWNKMSATEYQGMIYMYNLWIHVMNDYNFFVVMFSYVDVKQCLSNESTFLEDKCLLFKCQGFLFLNYIHDIYSPQLVVVVLVISPNFNRYWWITMQTIYLFLFLPRAAYLVPFLYLHNTSYDWLSIPPVLLFHPLTGHDIFPGLYHRRHAQFTAESVDPCVMIGYRICWELCYICT